MLRTQVLYHLVGMEHIATDLAAKIDFGFTCIQRISLVSSLAQFEFIELRLLELHCSGTVLMLTPFCLTGHDNSRGNMSETNRTVGLVDVLTTSAT